MWELAEECMQEGIEVTLVDAYAITEKLYQDLGAAEAWKFHYDQTHYNNYGAAYAAGLIAEEMKKEGVACCQELYTFEEVVERSEELKSTMDAFWAP